MQSATRFFSAASDPIRISICIQSAGDLGFGGDTKQAMQQRADFLAEQGLAEKRVQRVILAGTEGVESLCMESMTALHAFK